MNPKIMILLASARSDGNTAKVVAKIQSFMDSKLVDLKRHKINYFDYQIDNNKDDFMTIIKDFIANYETIIFATPIYWYSMSGRMKVFFDRLSELLLAEKELGRQLRTKKMALVSCSNDDDRVPSFINAFKLSAGYLGMEYLTDIHTWITESGKISELSDQRILKFVDQLQRR